MTRARHLVEKWSSPLALVSGLFCVNTLAAQQTTLAGRVIYPDGRPATDMTVVLHAVGASGGAAVDRAMSNASGRFLLVVPEDADPDAIYFAAVRYENGLYVGAMIRPPFGAESYEITLDGQPAFISGTSPANPRRAGGVSGEGTGAGSWWVIGIACLAAAAMLWMGIGPHVRPGEERRVLRDLAVLEESDRVESISRKRANLRRRLRQIVRE